MVRTSQASALLLGALGCVACSSSSGSGDAPVDGGNGGTTAATTAPGAGTSGGPVATGGHSAQSSAGGAATGGASSSGGTRASTGGTTSVGSVSASGGTAQGGSSATGGSSSQGGTSAQGGNSATGGSSSQGGSSARGGSSATGGSSSQGGTSGQGGSGTTTSTSATGGNSAHLYVQGSDLYAHCGEKVLLRGVNQMSVWTDATGSSYPAIASFGSNAIRIVYEQKGTAAGLDTLMTQAIAHKMIAMPELHDATGKFDGVAACVNWWTKPDVVSVIKKHEKWTLLNIANEAGDSSVSDATFISTYTSAITALRNAKIAVPIVIDGTGWGQRVEQLLSTAPTLLAADPLKSVIFSWHEYTGGAQENARITASYEKSKSLGIVLINGEFASGGAATCAADIPYKFLLAEAQRVGIGWLAWSWDVGNNDCKSGGTSIFDMTTNLTSASAVVAGWPADVLLNDVNSIKNTSVRPCEWK